MNLADREILKNTDAGGAKHGTKKANSPGSF